MSRHAETTAQQRAGASPGVLSEARLHASTLMWTSLPTRARARAVFLDHCSVTLDNHAEFRASLFCWLEFQQAWIDQY